MSAMLTAGLCCSTKKVHGQCKHHQVQLDSPCQDRAITLSKQISGHMCVVLNQRQCTVVLALLSTCIEAVHLPAPRLLKSIQVVR